MSISNYLETKILNLTLKNTAYTPPATVYLALYTTNPTDADTGTEVSGNGYARQPITFDTPAEVGGLMTISNSTEIDFPSTTGTWGTVAYIGIRDALTGGNLLYYGAVSNPKTIEASDILRYLMGNLKITLD